MKFCFGISSQFHRLFCVSLCCILLSRGPRGAKSPPEGNLEGRGGCIFRYIPTRVSVRTFSHPRQGGIRFNTVRLHCLGVVVGVVGLMGEVEVVRGKLKGNLEGEG